MILNSKFPPDIEAPIEEAKTKPQSVHILRGRLQFETAFAAAIAFTLAQLKNENNNEYQEDDYRCSDFELQEQMFFPDNSDKQTNKVLAKIF